MKKFTINGVEFNNFGSNNYSCGMELISCYPMPENMIQDVLAGKYHGVWLNPSAPCSNEFFGVFGTSEQYNDFYERQKYAQIAGLLYERGGGIDAVNRLSLGEFTTLKRQCESEYKDWWCK